jgi:hypothetical protein
MIAFSSPPDGASFARPGLEPFQSTKRGINPLWNSRTPTEGSKFCLKIYVHNGIPYSGIFDLPGLFLSSISRAPNRATTRNFYLPILAMYAKWAAKLNEPGPRMFNCTWIKEGPGKGSFFLGASLAGYLGGRGSNQTGKWAEVVKGARWAIINDPTVQMSGFSMYDSPAFRLTGDRKWFGSCAEVYPVVIILDLILCLAFQTVILNRQDLFGNLEKITCSLLVVRSATTSIDLV